jgi:hypothetical protein
MLTKNVVSQPISGKRIQ